MHQSILCRKLSPCFSLEDSAPLVSSIIQREPVQHKRQVGNQQVHLETHPIFFFSLIPSRKITSKSKHIKAAFWNHLLNIVYYMPEAGPCFPVTTRRINLPQSFHQTTSYNSTGSLALPLIGLRCQSSTGRKKRGASYAMASLE